MIDSHKPDLLPSKYYHSTHTHTHPFNGSLSGTTRISRYEKSKTNLDFTEARDSEWQWHKLGHVQVCTSLLTDNHASTPLLKFFTGRMPFLSPNQQHLSTVRQSNNKYYNSTSSIMPMKKETASSDAISATACNEQ